VLVDLGSVEPREVRWWWDRYGPEGRVTLVPGDPGLGKSFLTLALAAALTTGAPLPGHSEAGTPRRVLLLNAEDALDDTVRPRLDAMGADPSLVTALTMVTDGGRERWPSLVTDLEAVDRALSRANYALMIVDPLNAYLGTNLDTHRDAALRSVLGPVGALADKHRVGVLAVMHLRKGTADQPLYRVMGSIAYVGAARSVLLVGRDPEDETSPIRHLVPIKHNLTPKAPPSLKFELKDGRLWWCGESMLTARQLLAAPDDQDRTATDEAGEVLAALLRGGPVEVKKARAHVMRVVGCSSRTVDSARARLGVHKTHDGSVGDRGWVWMWTLPDLRTSQSSPVPRNSSSTAGNGEALRSTRAAGLVAISPPEPCPACPGKPLDWISGDDSGWTCGHCGRSAS
jgi:hypothetical protein